MIKSELVGARCETLEIAKSTATELTTAGHEPDTWLLQEIWQNVGILRTRYRSWHREVARGWNLGNETIVLAPKGKLYAYVPYKHMSGGSGIVVNSARFRFSDDKPRGWIEGSDAIECAELTEDAYADPRLGITDYQPSLQYEATIQAMLESLITSYEIAE